MNPKTKMLGRFDKNSGGKPPSLTHGVLSPSPDPLPPSLHSSPPSRYLLGAQMRDQMRAAQYGLTSEAGGSGRGTPHSIYSVGGGSESRRSVVSQMESPVGWGGTSTRREVPLRAKSGASGATKAPRVPFIKH